jgi:hypothetical protein
MRIVAFITPTQRAVIEKVLRHCGLWAQHARGPPDRGAAPQPPDPGELGSTELAPRLSSPKSEVRYVSDPAFVDAAPPEPVWTPEGSD